MNGAGGVLPIPDEFASGIKYNTLSWLLSKVGRLMDPERAAYCDKRYQLTQVAAELICDGVHVHPAAVRAAVAAKGCGRVMAITDGTAGSGLPRGTRTRLGGRTITVGDASYLDDGTLAGSVLTMDRAFSSMVTSMGFNLVDAARMCSTTAAGELGLTGYGALVTGGSADLVVLDYDFRVVETYIAGVRVFSRGKAGTALQPGPSMDV